MCTANTHTHTTRLHVTVEEGILNNYLSSRSYVNAKCVQVCVPEYLFDQQFVIYHIVILITQHQQLLNHSTGVPKTISEHVLELHRLTIDAIPHLRGTPRYFNAFAGKLDKTMRTKHTHARVAV